MSQKQNKTTSSEDERLIEKLAAIEHERWADWQKWIHKIGRWEENGSITLPADCVERWEKQINTPYAELSRSEQESDIREVKRYWPLIAHRDKLIEARARLNLIDEFGEKQSQSSISRGDMLAYLQVMQKQAEAEIKRLEGE